MKQVLQLNEKVIRLNAFFTLLIASSTLFVNSNLIPLFLVFDFLIRGFSDLKSPLTFISKNITRMLDLEYNPIYAPPKKFAAKVGFLFSSFIFIFSVIQWDYMVFIVSGILIVCAFLEAFLKICVGCYMFNWIIKFDSFNRSKKQ